MTATCKEDNDLNYQEIKCVNISEIITVTKYCQTIISDYLRFTKKDVTTVQFWTRDSLRINADDYYSLGPLSCYLFISFLRN